MYNQNIKFTMEEIKTKVCTKCGRELSIENFYINKSLKGGRDNCCKECKNAYAKEWARGQREKKKARKIENERIEFDGLDDAIGAINAMLIPECLTKGGAMTSVLERMTSSRSGTASLGSVDGLNVHIKNQKQVMIEKLEEELKRLKGE